MLAASFWIVKNAGHQLRGEIGEKENNRIAASGRKNAKKKKNMRELWADVGPYDRSLL